MRIHFLPDDDMADSFCLIPSKSEPSAASLKEENASLKAELEKQRQQLANMEAALKARQEQDQQLRDSIMLARKEVRYSVLPARLLMLRRPLWFGASSSLRSPSARREAQAEPSMSCRSGTSRNVIVERHPATDCRTTPSGYCIPESERSRPSSRTRSRRSGQRRPRSRSATPAARPRT